MTAIYINICAISQSVILVTSVCNISLWFEMLSWCYRRTDWLKSYFRLFTILLLQCQPQLKQKVFSVAKATQEVQMSVRSSVPKTPNSFKSFISPYHNIHQYSYHHTQHLTHHHNTTSQHNITHNITSQHHNTTQHHHAMQHHNHHPHHPHHHLFNFLIEWLLSFSACFDQQVWNNCEKWIQSFLLQLNNMNSTISHILCFFWHLAQPCRRIYDIFLTRLFTALVLVKIYAS